MRKNIKDSYRLANKIANWIIERNSKKPKPLTNKDIVEIGTSIFGEEVSKRTIDEVRRILEHEGSVFLRDRKKVKDIDEFRKVTILGKRGTTSFRALNNIKGLRTLIEVIEHHKENVEILNEEYTWEEAIKYLELDIKEFKSKVKDGKVKEYFEEEKHKNSLKEFTSWEGIIGFDDEIIRHAKLGKKALEEFLEEEGIIGYTDTLYELAIEEDILSEGNLTKLFKRFKNDEDKVIEYLRNKDTGVTNSDLQAIVEGFSLMRITDKSIKDSTLKVGKTYKTRTGHQLTVTDIVAGYSDLDGSPIVTIDYEFKKSSGEEGKSSCSTFDFFIMMTEKPKLTKIEAVSKIRDIIEDPSKTQTDYEGLGFLTQESYKEIKDIAKEAGLTRQDMRDISIYWFGDMGYAIGDKKIKDSWEDVAYQELLKLLTSSFSDYNEPPFLYDGLSEYEDFLTLYEIIEGDTDIPEKPMAVLTYLYNELEDEKDNWESRLSEDKKRLDWMYSTKVVNSPEPEDAKYLIIGLKELGSIPSDIRVTDSNKVISSKRELDKTVKIIESKNWDDYLYFVSPKGNTIVATKEGKQMLIIPPLSEDLWDYLREDGFLFDDEDLSINDSRLTRKQKIWYAEQLEKNIDPKFLRRNYRLKMLKGRKRK